MNLVNALENVLKKEKNIMENIEEYQSCCTSNNKGGVISLDEIQTSEEEDRVLNKTKKFFDAFSDDEIIVLQIIMYFGRDCKAHNTSDSYSDIEGFFKFYANELRFEGTGKIDRDREISTMMSKGLVVADYFKEGFKEIKKYS